MINKMFFIILLVSFSMFGQKKEKYFDINKIEVSQTDFDNFRKANESTDYYFTKIENDSLISYTIHSTLETIKLSEHEVKTFITYLEKISGKKIDNQKNTIIQYIPIFNDCILMAKDSYVKKKIKKKKNFNKLVVIIEKDHPKNKSGRYGPEDNEGIIKSFFSVDLGCGNHILIQPDGNCKILLGENNIEKILI